jgi:hypothetical protein
MLTLLFRISRPWSIDRRSGPPASQVGGPEFGRTCLVSRRPRRENAIDEETHFNSSDAAIDVSFLLTSCQRPA